MSLSLSLSIWTTSSVGTDPFLQEAARLRGHIVDVRSLTMSTLSGLNVHRASVNKYATSGGDGGHLQDLMRVPY